jgi:hypothetical protein
VSLFALFSILMMPEQRRWVEAPVDYRTSTPEDRPVLREAK